MAGGSQNNRGIIGGINVTPLVDITLVLLIIFMVTAKIIVAPAVPMDLPTASQSTEVQVIFSVIVPTTGPTLVNGEPAADDSVLLQRARDAVTQNPEVRAVVNADGAVTHRRVIRTLDILKRGGIARVAFGALSPEEGTP